ncbi:MAG: type IV pilin-like G/H family protein [Hormoscilla sp. GUM202]|nr:type IV pilin-like G/H family protein [Hormoscilla sp. GUM202]
MKTEFKTKFLQHLIDKKQDKGFTLIELLVVIIIIGILSSIALPSFLGQANKAKQSEAKAYVGSMNRAQQAYYLEKGELSDNLDILGLSIQTKTANYTYGITDGGTGSSAVTNWGTAIDKNAVLKSYVGGVNRGGSTVAVATTFTVLCESDKANEAKSAATYDETTGPSCPTNYTKI